MDLDLDFFDSKPVNKPVNEDNLLDLSAIPVLAPTKTQSSKPATPTPPNATDSPETQADLVQLPKKNEAASMSQDRVCDILGIEEPASVKPTSKPGPASIVDTAVLFDEDNQCVGNSITIGKTTKSSDYRGHSIDEFVNRHSDGQTDQTGRTDQLRQTDQTGYPDHTGQPNHAGHLDYAGQTDHAKQIDQTAHTEHTVDGPSHLSVQIGHAGVPRAKEHNADQLATGAFLAIAQYCDINTVKSLLFVSRNSHKAAISDSIWDPICKSVGIPDTVEEDSLIGSDANASNILQTKRVKGENSACRTFGRAFSILNPIIGNPQEYAHEAEPNELLERSHILTNAQKLTHALPELFHEATILMLNQVVASEQNRLLEIIAEHSQTSTKPSPKTFAACEVYFQSDEQFREKAIATYFSHLITEPIVQNAFIHYDDAEGISTRMVSQDKLEQTYNSVMSVLIAVNTEIIDPESILPPKWNQNIWLYMASKLIAQLVVYIRQVLDEAAQDISEEAYLAAVPQVYASSRILTENSIVNEIGSNFGFDFALHVTTDLLRPILDEFCERQTVYVNTFAKRKVKLWNESLSQREDETEKYIWSSVPKKSDKYSFISSFKWAFTSSTDDMTDVTAPSPSSPSTDVANKIPATEFEAQTAVLVSKLRGMESLVSIELVIEVMDTCRTAIRRLKSVHREDSKLYQTIFCTFLSVIGGKHIQPAFDRALKVLNSYDPKKYGRLMISMNKEQHGLHNRENNEPGDRQDGDVRDGDGQDSDVAVEPLVVFTELVNVGDLVQQMAHVFFEEELVATKMIRKSDFGAPSVNSKRKFEQMLDDMLAAGLSRGIDVLMDQVEFTMVTEQLGSDYLPPPVNAASFGPTVAAEKVINLVKSHLDLLRETTEKNLYEVFQHEVGVRLYTALSKHIKSQIISEEGAITLISDINAYYNFILSLRQRSLQPYYETLKQIAQLYLIDKKDAKQIGLAMSDSDRYNGLVTTEELIEFVRRRRDWPSIKSKVEKTLYGVFECVIC